MRNFKKNLEKQIQNQFFLYQSFVILIIIQANLIIFQIFSFVINLEPVTFRIYVNFLRRYSKLIKIRLIVLRFQNKDIK